MLPLRVPRPDPDTLIPLVGALAAVRQDEQAVLQVLFTQARRPWPESTMRAVTTPRGEPFFADAPNLTRRAEAKVESPLYAVALRVGVRTASDERTWETLRQVAGGLAQFGGPTDNTLIPLSGREDDSALGDLLNRTTHRTGMLWSLDELAALVHVPRDLAALPGLARVERTTRAAPPDLQAGELRLGVNRHQGERREVWLSQADRLRHTHIVGASGTGKSTLLCDLIRQDMEAGRGCAVLDPHGDLAEDVLGLVPEHREDDVIVIDPAAEEAVVGWNVLQAATTIERDILSSDLVAVFRRLSTSWGDQMTTVLANALDVVLERGGTLLDVRRFLVEEGFRRQIVPTIEDEYLRSYWTTEFPLIAGKKPQAPILTRLNTFLRPPAVRRVVTEGTKSIDFREILDDGRILIVNLAQGTIGAENAALLGALLVSKLCQVAIARQATHRERRRPFYLYIDEFHHVATPSMATLFASMRKYGLGLVVAHQGLEQLRSTAPDLERAVLANAHARVTFRVGERDARELGHAFAGFAPEDLASLRVGQAVCRVGGRDRSFSLTTAPPPLLDRRERDARRERVRQTSADRYGRPLEGAPPPPASKAQKVETAVPAAGAEPEAKKPPVEAPMGQGGPEHQYLQGLIREWGQAQGYRVTIEEPIDGGRVDVALRKGDATIACEIAVTTPSAHEIGNVEKCLAAGFDEVLLVSRRQGLLQSVEAELKERLQAADLAKVAVLSPEELWTRFDQEPVAPSEGGTVAGYAVSVSVEGTSAEESKARSRAITEVIARSVRKLKKGEK